MLTDVCAHAVAKSRASQPRLLFTAASPFSLEGVQVCVAAPALSTAPKPRVVVHGAGQHQLQQQSLHYLLHSGCCQLVTVLSSRSMCFVCKYISTTNYTVRESHALQQT